MPRWGLVVGSALLAGLLGWWTLSTLREPAWLAQARDLLATDENRTADAEKILHSQLVRAPRPKWRAQALTLLAGIAQGAERADSLTLLDQAIGAAREADLQPLVAQNVLDKSWFLGHSLHRYDEAERLLRQEQVLLDKLPANGIWARSQQALFRRAQGDLRGAVELLKQAEARARAADESQVLPELLNQRGTTLMMMGRLQESEALLSGITASVSAPCRRGRVLSTQGWIFNIARQTLHKNHPLWPKLDPSPRLLEAEALLRKCAIPHALANVLTNRAHVAATEGRFAELDSLLTEARQFVKEPNTNLRIEWEDLAGQGALARRDAKEATLHYQSLAKLGRKTDQYESVWLSLVGLAQAAAIDDRKRALALYQQAESYLDQRALELPLGAGRGTFLARFERGTANYIELLVNQQRHAEAVTVIRHARARGLWALGALARADALPVAQRKNWEAALASYRNARRELDALNITAAQDAEGPRQRFLQEQPERMRQLLLLLEAALRTLGNASLREGFRRPAPGELWLTCHPGSGFVWHCFAWDSRATPPRHVMLEGMGPEQMRRALLAFTNVLSPAKRLVVIAYGVMRTLDLHSLLWSNGSQPQPLDERFDVVYSLDLPWVVPSRDTNDQRALLVLDPQGRLPFNRRVAPEIAAALRESGWVVAAQIAGIDSQGNYPNKPVQVKALGGAQIRDLLPGVRLFHYGGHGDYEPVGGWGHKLRIADGTGLLVSDILTLDSVPEQVLLFGCNTGQSAEEVGGVEGLGLAQAFLLRGSAWVIATAREVSDQVAADMARAIYVAPALGTGQLALSGDPVAQLRSAKRKVSAADSSPSQREQIESFRIFVP